DEFVTRYALAYPAVRFRLTHDNRITFQTGGSGATADVLLAVYGPDTVRQLIAVGEAEGEGEGEQDAARDGATVRGYVSDPALTWSNRNQIQLFVNGRYVRDNRLAFAVIQAYHTLLPGGRYPLGLLFLSLPPADVDVNVHPTKVEVRFRDEGAMFGAVQRAVRAALLGTSPARALGGWPATETRPATWGGFDPETEARRDVPSRQLDIPWQLQGPAPAAPEPDDGAAALPLPTTDEPRLPIMRVVGQVGASYIITEGPDGLFLIDQHAAHERILYEQLLVQWKERHVVSQGLIAPATVYLSPSQAHLVEEHLPLLTGLGFAIEPFGPSAYQVRAVPALLGRADPAEALAAVVADLESGATPLQARTEALVIKRVCKTAAVKAGQILSREEMEAMIAQLEVCAVPHTCPHGRPTLIHLSAAQLARQFGRG
ncbi:DNA mismatch repair protein MutL, partial [Promineifilum sp.]|uniref:DNA mismatch repair protein MutL n=1 Tax=Promineifilum sp. TaxID=2664178 RepID=UPI0035B22ECC